MKFFKNPKVYAIISLILLVLTIIYSFISMPYNIYLTDAPILHILINLCSWLLRFIFCGNLVFLIYLGIYIFTKKLSKVMSIILSVSLFFSTFNTIGTLIRLLSICLESSYFSLTILLSIISCISSIVLTIILIVNILCGSFKAKIPSWIFLILIMLLTIFNSTISIIYLFIGSYNYINILHLNIYIGRTIIIFLKLFGIVYTFIYNLILGLFLMFSANENKK